MWKISRNVPRVKLMYEKTGTLDIPDMLWPPVSVKRVQETNQNESLLWEKKNVDHGCGCGLEITLRNKTDLIPYTRWDIDTVFRCSVSSCTSYTRLYQTIPEYTRLYQAILDYTRMYQSILDYTRVYQTIPECTRVYQVIQEYTRLYKSIPGCTKVYQSRLLAEHCLLKNNINTLIFFIQQLIR